ncbi:uncharacterized protein LOC111467373 [Cucurbita maxima]|uniref:Uncharacterized protein LOC111467373 n=1 Tax=Cucurbita maxima TaxID=3661 RepID=A0A6J1HYC2_CUCMA|nr:uncharacterized protein LOC111467373 [Cucurbita maxima]
MVSRRQKLARKKYREEHPELFPKAEPTPPKDPEKKKKKSEFKRKKGESDSRNDPNKPHKKGFKKHPLRVPGMKPGESCFICKAKDHIAKFCPEKAQWEKNKICLLCRRRGHSLKNCPDKTEDTVDKKLCYNCGETGHSLANCPQPLQHGGTKYANCFICNESGHLSKNCPKNTHGIYPKGGCCKTCGEVTHLAKDCPKKGTQVYAGPGVSSNRSSGYVEMSRRPETRLVSGDDLEDDFMVEEDNLQIKDAKLGNKKGPKVVKFMDCMKGGIEKCGEHNIRHSKQFSTLVLSLKLLLFSSLISSHLISPPKIRISPSPSSSLTFLFSSLFLSLFSSIPLSHTFIHNMANAASGMVVRDECKLKFLELKTKRNYRFIIFKIENQEVVVEKLGSPTETYDDFTAAIPPNECRYAVFDFDFTTDENCQKSKIFFIAWSPDTSIVRNKMVYASSKDRFKRELDGIQVELQATDASEMSFDIIKARAF